MERNFCVTKKSSRGLVKHFNGFESCPRGLTQIDVSFDDLLKNNIPLNQSGGVYVYKKRGNDDRLLEQWRDKHMECAFDDVMRQKWGDMIVDASNKISNQTLNLFEKSSENVTTIAIHVRRGDYAAWGRTLIPDESCVVLLRRLRSILTKAGKVPEVHLFSEDYGIVHKKKNITLDWNLYHGLVDRFHLAKDMRQFGVKGGRHILDMDLNLRDWRHFVLADVLIVGSPFSGVPALGRRRGLTLDLWGAFRSGSSSYYKYGWLEYPNGCICPNELELYNLPSEWARYDTISSVEFFRDLNMSQWNVGDSNCSHTSPPICQNQTSTHNPYIRKCVA